MNLAAESSGRIKRYAMGDVPVPAERLWGAQTQRSLLHFANPHERMPAEFLHAMALTKRATAVVNGELGLLDAAKGASHHIGR